MMEQGIEITALLNSKIFNVEFDFDDWPGNHPLEDKCIRAYNGSYFDIRLMYDQVFPEEEFSKNAPITDRSKVYKIKYSVNLLGQCGRYCISNEDGEIEDINEDVNIMALAEGTEELDIFSSSAMTDIIEYRWEFYGNNFHLLSLFMNITYIVSLILYVIEAYIEGGGPNEAAFLLFFNLGLVYPVGYELI